MPRAPISLCVGVIAYFLGMAGISVVAWKLSSVVTAKINRSQSAVPIGQKPAQAVARRPVAYRRGAGRPTNASCKSGCVRKARSLRTLSLPLSSISPKQERRRQSRSIAPRGLGEQSIDSSAWPRNSLHPRPPTYSTGVSGSSLSLRISQCFQNPSAGWPAAHGFRRQGVLPPDVLKLPAGRSSGRLAR